MDSAAGPEEVFGGPAYRSGSGEAEVDYNLARGESVNIGANRGYRDYRGASADSDGSASYGQTGPEEESRNRESFYGGGYGARQGQDSGSRGAYQGGANGSAGQGSRDGSFGNRGNGQNHGGRQQYGYYPNQPNPPRNTGSSATKTKKKKNSGFLRRVLAAVLVIALCGAAGFGGATLANKKGGSGTQRTTSNVKITGDVTSVDAASAIAEKVMPSVVGISTISQSQTQTLFGIQNGTVQGIGTGIIVSEDGYILTNSHVVNDGDTEQITVDLYDGTEYAGEVLWNDSTLDLAIVKIDASDLTAAELGDSDDVSIGNYALAIGNPLGLNYERSVASGIISGLNRTITTQDESSGKTNNMDGLIQTDAAINAGNSGGPLINSSGQVIGINTAKASSSEGLGFAIPINTATPIIKQIKEKGSYEQTYIGIAGVDLSTINEDYVTDFETDSGVYIMQIYTDSPAASAGLKEGDIITEVDGKAVDGMSSLKSRMINYSPGDEIELTIERDKQSQKVKLTLGSSEDAGTSLQPNNGNSNGSSGAAPDEGSGNEGNEGAEGAEGSDGGGSEESGGFGFGGDSGLDGGLGGLFGR